MAWYEHAYPGGPMVGPPFPRALYPPDAQPGHPFTEDGPDVKAAKRALWRGGRWPGPAANHDDTYSNQFAHGKSGNVADSGMAGFQRQMKIDDSGWLGKATGNAIRSARIPEGLPNAGEPLLDATAVGLLEAAYDQFAGSPDTRCQLSEHFQVEEFDCHDGTKCAEREYEGLKQLCATFLEPLRDRFGSVHVNSGFRTPSYNASVGGASNSFHIYTQHNGYDQASDVTCPSGSPQDWFEFLNGIRQSKRSGNGGLGLYSTFVHVDMRDYPSTWNG